MHIIFILGGYYPYYSAVGKCVGNVADELAKENQVTVICQKNFIKQQDVEIINNQKIIRLDTRDNIIRNKLDEKIGLEKGLKKKIYQLNLVNHKIVEVVKIIFSSVTIRKQLVNEYIKILYKINEPIDLIIPASMPFESVIATSKYIEKRNNKIQMIPYMFDQFADNKTLHRTVWNMKLKKKNHIKLEKKILINSKSILIMPQLKKHFTEYFSDYDKKINVVEHPLIKKYSNNNHQISENLNIVYTGSFYKDIRNPRYFLEVVDNVSTLIKAKINIYSFGDCDEMLTKYSNANKLIINHGKVVTEKAYEAISKSDILVAVGNKDNSQVPSKIFEYLSFGKPIIYFYSVDDDNNLKVLNKYSLSLCLKQDFNKLNENVNKFNEFCNKHLNSNVDFEEVEKIYYNATPKYTANLIKELMRTNNNI